MKSDRCPLLINVNIYLYFSACHDAMHWPTAV